MQRLLRYLELILTAVGLLVVAVVFSLFRNIQPWKAAAVAALAVGVLHGIIFFSVRSPQRRVRNEALARVRRHLDDRIRNKLQVLLCATEIEGDDWRPVVHGAVMEIERSAGPHRAGTPGCVPPLSNGLPSGLGCAAEVSLGMLAATFCKEPGADDRCSRPS